MQLIKTNCCEVRGPHPHTHTRLGKFPQLFSTSGFVGHRCTQSSRCFHLKKSSSSMLPLRAQLGCAEVAVITRNISQQETTTCQRNTSHLSPMQYSFFFLSCSTLSGPPTRSESFPFLSYRSAATGKGVVSLHGGVPACARGGRYTVASSLNSAKLWTTEAVIYNLSALRPACAQVWEERKWMCMWLCACQHLRGEESWKPCQLQLTRRNPTQTLSVVISIDFHVRQCLFFPHYWFTSKCYAALKD